MLEKILIVLAVLIVLGLIWLAFAGIRLFRTTRDWARLFRSGAESVELVSIEPPRGFLRHREAKVTLNITNPAGESKEVERVIPVPLPQAFLWRVGGRVPTPLGRITDKRYFRRHLFHRRKHSHGSQGALPR